MDTRLANSAWSDTKTERSTRFSRHPQFQVHPSPLQETTTKVANSGRIPEADVHWKTISWKEMAILDHFGSNPTHQHESTTKVAILVPFQTEFLRRVSIWKWSHKRKGPLWTIWNHCNKENYQIPLENYLEIGKGVTGPQIIVSGNYLGR